MNQSSQLLPALQGPIAVTVPHMDDEVIGCGALLASLENKAEVHFFFCGNGLGSFTEKFIADYGREKLIRLRKQEMASALAALGYDAPDIHSADLEEWIYHRQEVQLRANLNTWLDRIQPETVLTPFRMDCHRDHLTLSAETRAWCAHHPETICLEYFVYYNLRLLKEGDMRKQIAPQFLYSLNSGPFNPDKVKALKAYSSQHQMFDPAWNKPVLSDTFIQSVASGNEFFLDTQAANISSAWLKNQYWVRFVHCFEPRMKKVKDLTVRRLQ